MSQREYAKRRGVTQPAVAAAVRTGRIKKAADGRIDPDKADRDWVANTDQSKPRNSITGNPKNPKGTSPIDGNGSEAARREVQGSYAAARAVRETMQAKIAQIELQRIEGGLVDKEEVRREVFESHRKVRDALLALPRRLAPLVVGLDIEEIVELMQREIDRVCKRLSS